MNPEALDIADSGRLECHLVGRQTLSINASNCFRDYFSDTRLAPVFSREHAREPKINGAEGLSPDFEPDAWQLRVVGRGGVRREV
jgi:hypothetical protein